MSAFPKMIYRDGNMLPEHGVDYMIVACGAELASALADGWREGLEPVEAAPVALRKRGRPRKAVGHG